MGSGLRSGIPREPRFERVGRSLDRICLQLPGCLIDPRSLPCPSCVQIALRGSHLYAAFIIYQREPWYNSLTIRPGTLESE